MKISFFYIILFNTHEKTHCFPTTKKHSLLPTSTQFFQILINHIHNISFLKRLHFGFKFQKGYQLEGFFLQQTYYKLHVASKTN